MAELACLASIIQLADVGARVALTLFSIAESVKSAASDAHLIATDVSLFSQALGALGKSLKDKISYDDKLVQIADCIAKSCEVLIKELSALTREFAPDARQHVKVFAGFKWTFKKGRIKFLQSSLESLKSTMLLLVASIDLAEAKADTTDKSPLQAQVVSLMKVSEAAAGDLVESAQRQYRPALEMFEDDDSGVADVWTLVHTEDFDEEIPSRNTKGAHLAMQHARHSTSALEIGKLVLYNEEPVLPIGLAAIDVQSQQLVYHLAADILKSSSTAAEHDGTLDNAEEFDDIHDVNEEIRQNFSYETDRPQFSAPKSQKQEGKKVFGNHTRSETSYPDPLQSPRGTQPGNREAPRRHHSFLSDFTSQKGVRSPPRHKSFGDNTKQPARDQVSDTAPLSQDINQRLTETLESLSVDDQKLLSAEPIRFNDPTGRKFSFPYHLASKWKGMVALMQQIFLSDDQIGQYILNGYYDLVGPDQEIMLPQLWEALVRPGWTITMLMWPQTDLPPHVITNKNYVPAEEKVAADTAKRMENYEKLMEEHRKRVVELEEAKRKAEDEANALRPPDDMLKPPLRFKDAVGRKFSFPWHLCKTWKGMEALIMQAFLHVDIIGQHVHEGHYDLIGPDGEIILPQVWETMVKPDWAIEMKMWPMPEKKPSLPPPPPPLMQIPPPPPFPGEIPVSLSQTSRAKIRKDENQLSKFMRRLRRRPSSDSVSTFSF